MLLPLRFHTPPYYARDPMGLYISGGTSDPDENLPSMICNL